ncbi:MAG: chlorite dismutase family protein, partial [Planctomycetaceae bacterium]|nr:chlorite dismutase family protein [Planctomycetaceae bacterium]
MSGPPSHVPQQLPEPSISLAEGWHCLHLYYKVDQAALCQLGPAARSAGAAEFAQILDPKRDGAPERLQVSVVSGHRADLGLMLLDKDPLKLDGIHQALRASPLGTVFTPVYS